MNYWAWGGKYASNRSGDYLYSPSGKPVGWFDEEELFDFTAIISVRSIMKTE